MFHSFGYDDGKNFVVSDLYSILFFKTKPSKSSSGAFLYSEQVTVADLDPTLSGVLMTIPTISGLKDINMTYGCGAINDALSTFKDEGCLTYFTDPSNSTITCYCNHATTFGVQQYVAPEIIEVIRERPIPEIPRGVGSLGNALCLWFALAFLPLLFLCIPIGKCRD
ncbi:hypothetical protein COB52_05690 [Candidatus Kaiserbacteria bacterium]|nr:MAG: hypothetical protein COB52_05690 [Candidatus Kaiserbacteria bacterium]